MSSRFTATSSPDVFRLTVATADVLVDRLKSEVRAPYVNAYKSTLGGEHNVSVLVAISMDAREAWTNGIFENSRHTKLHILTDGTVEQITNWKLDRFRKTRCKSIDQIVAKINEYLAKSGA